MAFLRDSDLLCVERGGISHRWTGKNLKDQVIELSPISQITGTVPIIVTELSNRVVNIAIRDGTINQQGAVQLSNTVNSSQTLALTPKGAKTALDQKTNLDGGNAVGTWNISISGNAATATNAVNSTNSENTKVIRDNSSNANRFLTFANNNTPEFKTLMMDNGLYYNPSTNTLTCTNFSGNVDGTASNADQAQNSINSENATYATNINILQDASNAERYVNFSSRVSGQTRIRADSNIRYNPLSNTITTGNLVLSGNITANKVTAKSADINGTASIDKINVVDITATRDGVFGRHITVVGTTFTGIVYSTGDCWVGNNLIIQKGRDHQSILWNDGAAYFANEKIWLYKNGDIACVNFRTNDITASSVNASKSITTGSVNAQSIDVSADIRARNLNLSNQLTASNIAITNHMSGKSIALSSSLSAPSISGTNGKFTGVVESGTFDGSSVVVDSAKVNGNLNSGTINAGRTILSDTLAAPRVEVQQSLSTNELRCVNGATIGRLKVNGELESASIKVEKTFSTYNATVKNNLSVNGGLYVADDLIVGDQANVKHLSASHTVYTYGHFNVRKGSTATCTIFNDGSAYFTSGQIWLLNTGDISCKNFHVTDINARNIKATGSFSSASISTGKVDSTSLTTSGDLKARGGTFSGNVTAKDITASGSITGQIVGSRTNMNVGNMLVVSNGINVSRDINCGGWVLPHAISTKSTVFVGGDFVVRDTNNDYKCRIFNDGSAFFSDEKIWAYNTGDMFVTGGVTCKDLSSLSDKRHKTDITQITEALSTVEKLNGVNFTWKDSGKESMGVIAQEVEEVLPKLISINKKDEDSEGTKSVNYNGLVGVLIEAVKELSARVEELENN